MSRYNIFPDDVKVTMSVHLTPQVKLCSTLDVVQVISPP